MSAFEHHRWRIFNPAQHPLQHDLGAFGYTNPRLPASILTMQDTVDYIISTIYPNWKGTVATPAALPPVGAQNDYYFVTDDGDGKSAGYVWQQIDDAGQWVKRYDVDWSLEGILAETLNRTQYMYYHKYGMTDKDPAGVPLAGDWAGQHIYGGDTAGQNLGLHANSGDILPAATGAIICHDPLRPIGDDDQDLGSATHQWSNLYAVQGYFVGLNTSGAGDIGTDLQVGNDITAIGNITGANLSGTNTGDVTLAAIGSTPNANAATLTGQVLNLEPASALFGGVVTTGTQTFAGEKTFSADAYFSLDLDVLGDIIAHSDIGATGNITGANLSGTNTGDVSLGAVGAVPNANGASLTGQVLNLQPCDSTNPGVLTAGAQFVGGVKTFQDGLLSVTSASFETLTKLDDETQLQASQYFTVGGLVQFAAADFFTLNNVAWRNTAKNQAAQSGDYLIFNGSVWLASAPPAHSGLSGLTTGDAGHTQFAMLAGRAGGQSLFGGTASSEPLTLAGNSADAAGDATNKVIFNGHLVAGVNNGIDLGNATGLFRNLYLDGFLITARIQNRTVGTMLPAGRSGAFVWTTDEPGIYVDNGVTWNRMTVRKHQSVIVADGVALTYNVNVSADMVDARNALWQLRAVGADYEVLGVVIKMTSASNVRIETEVALPAGNYSLIGLE